MADTNPAQTEDSGVAHELKPAPLVILNQYIKDFSFENPNPEKSFGETKEAPEISLDFNVQVDSVKDQEQTFEVTIHLKVEAKRPSHTMFIAELQYAGLFKLGAVPQDAIHPILMIECPRMLFPYARQIIANVTREGGFPSLSLTPIDFVELYRKQYVESQQQEA